MKNDPELFVSNYTRTSPAEDFAEYSTYMMMRVNNFDFAKRSEGKFSFMRKEAFKEDFFSREVLANYSDIFVKALKNKSSEVFKYCSQNKEAQNASPSFLSLNTYNKAFNYLSGQYRACVISRVDRHLYEAYLDAKEDDLYACTVLDKDKKKNEVLISAIDQYSKDDKEILSLLESNASIPSLVEIQSQCSVYDIYFEDKSQYSNKLKNCLVEKFGHFPSIVTESIFTHFENQFSLKNVEDKIEEFKLKFNKLYRPYVERIASHQSSICQNFNMVQEDLYTPYFDGGGQYYDKAFLNCLNESVPLFLDKMDELIQFDDVEDQQFKKIYPYLKSDLFDMIKRQYISIIAKVAEDIAIEEDQDLDDLLKKYTVKYVLAKLGK